MKTILIAIVSVTAIVPPIAALTIAPKGGGAMDVGQMMEAPAEDAAKLDSAQSDYDNVANQVHSRIIEVTNDTTADHQLIRIHWTVNSEVWIWAFKLQFTYFDENRKPVSTETQWMYAPNEDGSYNPVPPHSPIENWHELTVPTDQANKFKAVSVLVETAYRPD